MPRGPTGNVSSFEVEGQCAVTWSETLRLWRIFATLDGKTLELFPQQAVEFEDSIWVLQKLGLDTGGRNVGDPSPERAKMLLSVALAVLEQAGFTSSKPAAPAPSPRIKLSGSWKGEIVEYRPHESFFVVLAPAEGAAVYLIELAKKDQALTALEILGLNVERTPSLSEDWQQRIHASLVAELAKRGIAIQEPSNNHNDIPEPVTEGS
jgi:hypothetical protein